MGTTPGNQKADSPNNDEPPAWVAPFVAQVAGLSHQLGEIQDQWAKIQEDFKATAKVADDAATAAQAARAKGKTNRVLIIGLAVSVFFDLAISAAVISGLFKVRDNNDRIDHVVSSVVANALTVEQACDFLDASSLAQRELWNTIIVISTQNNPNPQEIDPAVAKQFQDALDKAYPTNVCGR